MKKLILGLIMLSSAGAFSQVVDPIPFIEVTGTAEKTVVPNEIYISINIHERYDGKTKVTIEEQETGLKELLIKKGFNLEDLSLSDSESSYVKVRWTKKDVLSKKELVLKVNSADKVGEVFAILDELNLQDAHISKVDHSEKDAYKKEVRIMAIKAAKEKAFYLLEAIDEKPGNPLVIYENAHQYVPQMRNVAYSENMKDGLMSSNNEPELTIQFEKITIRASIYVKYSIE